MVSQSFIRRSRMRRVSPMRLQAASFAFVSAVLSFVGTASAGAQAPATLAVGTQPIATQATGGGAAGTKTSNSAGGGKAQAASLADIVLAKARKLLGGHPDRYTQSLSRGLDSAGISDGVLLDDGGTMDLRPVIQTKPVKPCRLEWVSINIEQEEIDEPAVEPEPYSADLDDVKAFPAKSLSPGLYVVQVSYLRNGSYVSSGHNFWALVTDRQSFPRASATFSEIRQKANGGSTAESLATKRALQRASLQILARPQPESGA